MSLAVSNNTPQILGNFIGTNAAGNAAIPNGGFGLRFSGVLSKVISSNVISGNTGGGMQIQKANNSSGTNDIISDNLIGTDATGNNPLGNNGIGLVLGSGVSNGGTTAQIVTGNTIVANTSHGVLVDGGSSLLLQNNFIGTNSSLAANLGNGGDGMRFISQFRDNQIGAAGAGNTIAYNAGSGISLENLSISSTGNRISHNAIFSNGGLGIDLGGDGVTANDDCDGENGVNTLQNYPEMQTAATSNFTKNGDDMATQAAGFESKKVRKLSSLSRSAASRRVRSVTSLAMISRARRPPSSQSCE